MVDVGNNITAANAGWSFDKGVASTFDEHVKSSVPLYVEGHKLICDISDYFVSDDSICYDLGTSTGELAAKLWEHNKVSKPNSRFIGIDSVQEMIDQASEKFSHHNANNLTFIADDILSFEYEKSDLITSYYTIQFVKPNVRQDLFNKIFESLHWGGAFLLFEKVRACDARFQDICSGLYTEFKVQNGYSPEEMFAKTRSLKGVLEPFSTEGNIDLLKRAGFKDVLSVMKYVSFEGFLAIK